jgi:hypothetical protein
MLDYGEQVFDGVGAPAGLKVRVRQDIDALFNLAITGQRAMWQLVVSQKTYREVAQTADGDRKERLETWFGEIWAYWQDALKQVDPDPGILGGREFADSMRASGVLECLPDQPDRALLLDALGFGCDLFCTRDWTSILKHTANWPNFRSGS